MASLAGRLSRFLKELRRRHVFRVAIAYGAVGWLLLQFVDIVFPALGLADITVTLVVLLVLAGFPIALLLAWAYDLTPAGVERTRPADDPASAPAGGGEFQAGLGERARARPTRSIAALPFVNLSRDTADDYFSDGLTEELINALTRVQGLRVAARTSAFAFKGSALDVREIGKRLEVASVLEGSVRTAGSKLRMSVQLINVDDGYCLWSEIFDRELGDVFAVQEEIARAVVGRLMIRPPGDTTIHLAAPPTDSLEAFTLYLRGRYFWNRRQEPDLRRAIELFEEAIAADPGYALAHTGLADAYSILLDHGLMSPQEALPNAIRAAERALELDPTLAEAHTSLALVRQFEWQWDGAEAAFRRALQLNPGYPVAHHRYALFLAWVARNSEALAQIEEAHRLDPVNLIIQATIGWILYYGRRYDEAAKKLRGALEMDAHFTNAHVSLALVLHCTGRPAEAITELEQAIRDSGGSTPILAILGLAYGAAGQTDKARAIMAEMTSRAERSYVSAYYRALPHLGLGENDDTLDWLQRAYNERAANMVYLDTDPVWDPLRGDSRFQQLLERLGFPRARAALAEPNAPEAVVPDQPPRFV